MATGVLAATKSNNTRILQLLLQGPTNTQDVSQALFYAVQEGLAECLSCLLTSDVDPNVTNASGDSLLHLAVREGHAQVVAALCQRGADTRAKGSGNSAPVHIAAKWGKDDCLELLIQHGCDVNSRDSTQSTPLILSVKNKQYGAIRLLLDAHCNVNVRDRSGRTALHFGSLSGTAVEQLLRAGADVNICDADGCSPLLYAATEGLERVVRCLVHAPNCDVNLSNKTARKTPLHILAYKGHDSSVKELMEHGADPGLRDAESKTAMWYAVSNCHTKVVKALLVHTFDVNRLKCTTEAPTSTHCPVHLALHKGLGHVVKLFIMTCFDTHHVIQGLHQPNAHDLFENMTEWIIQGQRVPTLQQHCRKWIRHHVRPTNIHSNTFHLPIPKKFVDYVLMKDIEEYCL